ncbi:MAG: tetratricopeptide repeat protein [Thermoguttaceae bacterium]|jgi:tetratricopeptide (TPR) repeat protein
MDSKTREQSDAPQPAPGLLQRLKALIGGPRAMAGSAVASRLRVAILGMALLAVMGAGATTTWLLRNRRPPEPPATLAMALAALDGNNLAQARRLAEKLQRQGGLATAEWGGPDFVLGVAAMHDADAALDTEKPAQYRAAARLLQTAYDRGFPEGRQAEGLYLLGQSLCSSGAFAASRPFLQAALRAGPDHASQLHRLLAEAWLAEATPAPDKALAEIQQYLAAASLTAAERNAGLLQRAQILFRLGRTADCAAVLDKIPPQAALRGEIAVLRGRMLYRQAKSLPAAADARPADRQQARKKYQAAIEAFRLAQGLDTVGNRATYQAMYLTGLCLAELDDPGAALKQLARTSKLATETPEGLAAALAEAELARRTGSDAVALAAYRRVLASISLPEELHNPWFSLPELRAAVLAASQDYLAAGKFDTAFSLCRALHPLFPKTRALEMTANVLRTWGHNLLEQAENLPADRAELLRRQGRYQLRRAGSVYAELARLQITARQYPELLWNSAAACLQGRDYTGAVRMLKTYLQNEARQRHPQALADLAEALLALDQWDEALEACQRCIAQHPRDVAAYRARLLAAQAAGAKGDIKQAEAFLLENLSGEHLTPASKEWRDSLFALGELLHGQGRYGEAIRRLEEAAVRYPDAPQALQAHYLIADAAQRSARAVQAGLNQEVSAVARAEGAAEKARLLEKALAEYRAIQDSLARREERDLPPLGRAILRNSRFAVGEVCLGLERYEQALQAYASAAHRYPNRPEVLDAYVQISNVYRRLERPAEARTSLEQARAALRRFPGDVRFETTTNYDRRQWGQILDWMCSL